MERTEKLHNQDKARERRQEGEEGSRHERRLDYARDALKRRVLVQTVASENNHTRKGLESLKRMRARFLCPVLRRNEQT